MNYWNVRNILLIGKMNGLKDCDKNHQETFRYTFSSHNIPDYYKVEVAINIPFEGSIKELSHRIINEFNLPIYFIEGNK